MAMAIRIAGWAFFAALVLQAVANQEEGHPPGAEGMAHSEEDNFRVFQEYEEVLTLGSSEDPQVAEAADHDTGAMRIARSSLFAPSSGAAEAAAEDHGGTLEGGGLGLGHGSEGGAGEEGEETSHAEGSGEAGHGGIGFDMGAEKEEEPSAVNKGISVMLLGSVVFVMALYELTNCHYKVVRKNTWQVLSATISIFSSVLIFQGTHGLVEAYILEPMVHRGYVVMAHVGIFIQALVWFLSLQVVLAMTSGVLTAKLDKDGNIEDVKVTDDMERKMKTFGILLGHISGFAAIAAFAELQQHLTHYGAWAVLAVAPAAWLLIVLVGRLTDFVRESVALMDNDTKDPHEELWDECCEDTEDDMIGLTVSFSFILAVRFAISGVMANAEGEEHHHQAVSHPRWQSLVLVGIGILLVGIMAIRVITENKKKHSEKSNASHRFSEQAKNVTGMTFSWSIYFGMQWVQNRLVFSEDPGMTSAVVLALSVTLVAMLMILGLLFVEIKKDVSNDMSAVLRAIINAVGILIGFAWEKSFDQAVNEISLSIHIVNKPITKLVLALMVILIVAPSWYRHIMPTILDYEKKEKDDRESKESGSGEDSDMTSSTDNESQRQLNPGPSRDK